MPPPPKRKCWQITCNHNQTLKCFGFIGLAYIIAYLINGNNFCAQISSAGMLNSASEGDTADNFVVDENRLDLTQLLNSLRGEIKFDESVAMKSAMLLKLLEVSSIFHIIRMSRPILFVRINICLGYLRFKKINSIDLAPRTLIGLIYARQHFHDESIQMRHLSMRQKRS